MSHPLDSWCRTLVGKYGGPSAVKPKQLAQEFVENFGVSSYPTLDGLVVLARQVGLASVRFENLPEGMPGHHYELDGRYQIGLKAGQWSGRSMFTIGHEFEEIIQKRFEALLPGYHATRRTDAPTCRGYPANRFAACLLMQEAPFQSALLSSGLDVIRLGHEYHQAYQTIAIRAKEVLNDSGKVDALVAIYERHEPESHSEVWGPVGPTTFEVTCAVRTRGIKAGRRGGRPLPRGWWEAPDYKAPRYPGHLIPQRGDGVNPHSVVQRVIATGQPALTRRAHGFDLFRFNDLSALARPVHWNSGELAKVVLVAVPIAHTSVLEAQLSTIAVEEVGECFQTI